MDHFENEAEFRAADKLGIAGNYHLPMESRRALHQAMCLVRERLVLAEANEGDLDYVIANYLPRQFNYDPGFARKLTSEFAALEPRIRSHETISMRSTAEELLVRAIQIELKISEEIGECEPMSNRAAEALDDFFESIVEDWDVELLFDPSMDGFERGVKLTKDAGLAHLAFEEWFQPFHEGPVQTLG